MIRVNVDIGGVIASLNGKMKHILPGGAQYESLQRTVGDSLLGDDKTRIHENGWPAKWHKDRQLFYQANVCKCKGERAEALAGRLVKPGYRNLKPVKKGKDHTSRYFPGGYNQYKTVIGRNQLGSVNLSLAGRLNNQLLHSRLLNAVMV